MGAIEPHLILHIGTYCRNFYIYICTRMFWNIVHIWYVFRPFWHMCGTYFENLGNNKNYKIKSGNFEKNSKMVVRFRVWVEKILWQHQMSTKKCKLVTYLGTYFHDFGQTYLHPCFWSFAEIHMRALDYKIERIKVLFKLLQNVYDCDKDERLTDEWENIYLYYIWWFNMTISTSSGTTEGFSPLAGFPSPSAWDYRKEICSSHSHIQVPRILCNSWEALSNDTFT